MKRGKEGPLVVVALEPPHKRVDEFLHHSPPEAPPPEEAQAEANHPAGSLGHG